jgi:hypothetical protein
MKTRQAVALSMLAGLALGALAVQSLRAAEDGYVRKMPLDALTVPVPVPIIPQGSSLDLRPGRAPDAGEQINGYTPFNRESTTPSIGLSIKPLDDRK